MENREQKIKAYIGFLQKSGKAIFGLDNLETCRKRVYLILFSADLAESSTNKLTAFAKSKQIPIALFNGNMETLCSKSGVKIISCRNGDLARAIIGEINGLMLENNSSFKILEE